MDWGWSLFEVRCKVCRSVVKNTGCDACGTPLCSSCFSSHFCPGGGCALDELLLRELRTAAAAQGERAALPQELQLMEKGAMLLLRDQVVPELGEGLREKSFGALGERELTDPLHVRISVGELKTGTVLLRPADVDVEVSLDPAGPVVLKTEMLLAHVSFEPLQLGYEKLAWPRLADSGKATATIQTFAVWMEVTFHCQQAPDGQKDLSTLDVQVSKTSSNVAKISIEFEDTGASWLYDGIVWFLRDRLKQLVLSQVNQLVRARLEEHLPELREAYRQAFQVAQQLDQLTSPELEWPGAGEADIAGMLGRIKGQAADLALRDPAQALGLLRGWEAASRQSPEQQVEFIKRAAAELGLAV